MLSFRMLGLDLRLSPGMRTSDSDSDESDEADEADELLRLMV